MDLILKTRAIHKLRPNAEWRLDENTGLEFFDNKIVSPTDEEIEKAALEIQKSDEVKSAEIANKKAALLERLGITEEEAKLLLS